MVKLSDVCDVRDGTHDTPKYVEYGYPLVTSKNIKDGQLDLSVVNFITEEDYNKINERSKVDVGDIIMPMIGTIGNPYLIEGGSDFAIKNVALIKCDNIKVINRFIWYFLQSDAFERYVDRKNKGGTQKFLSLGDIRNIELPEISIDVQKDIIEILSYVDSIVAKRKQQLQKLNELVKARFVEMFGDVPVNNYVALKDLCLIITDGTHQPPKFTTEGIPFLFVSNIVSNKITYDTTKFIAEETYSELMKRTPIEIGDVLLSTVGSYGHPAVVENDVKFCFQRHIAYLKPNKNIMNSWYLQNALLFREVQYQIDEKVKGIAQKTLNLSEIKTLRIPLPSLEQQNLFADFVQQIDKSKLHVQKSLGKLEILKKSLMQKYFG